MVTGEPAVGKNKGFGAHLAMYHLGKINDG
jgi:hypothetical protein